MVEINGVKYEIVEITGEKYQSVMERVENEFGDGWQTKVSKQAKLQAIMLAACLQAEDGSFVPEDLVMKLPQRLINKYSAEATELNGLSPEAREVSEKN